MKLYKTVKDSYFLLHETDLLALHNIDKGCYITMQPRSLQTVVI